MYEPLMWEVTHCTSYGELQRDVGVCDIRKIDKQSCFRIARYDGCNKAFVFLRRTIVRSIFRHYIFMVTNLAFSICKC